MYLLDGIDDPKEVWEKLHDQYFKKMWANKLELRKRLHTLRLKERESIQHIRQMTVLFRRLAEMNSPLTKDKVVYLLASLPKLFGVLVTALEAYSEVHKMGVGMECCCM